MSSGPTSLGERIRELRRRHYGPRGRARLAGDLKLADSELERFERGTIPPADVLVRLCEITGEDLQWLLTGVSARGTMVISGARGRHQALLAKVAQALETRPQLAAPIEAFVELLQRGPENGPSLPPARHPERQLIPIFEANELPDRLEPVLAETSALAVPHEPPSDELVESIGQMAEPASSYAEGSFHRVRLFAGRDEQRGASKHRFLDCAELTDCAVALLGVNVADETMAPMFNPGDAAIVALTAESKIGRPAFCKFAGDSAARCRMWLGRDASQIHLGRIRDGGLETEACERLLWSFEVIFRVAAA